MTKKVILLFPSRAKLLDFKSVVAGRFMEILFKSPLMVCDCSDAEIELAKRHYDADVFEYKEKFMPRN